MDPFIAVIFAVEAMAPTLLNIVSRLRNAAPSYRRKQIH